MLWPGGQAGRGDHKLNTLQPTLYAEWLINVPGLPRGRVLLITRQRLRQPRSSPGRRLSLPALSQSKNPFRRTL